MACNSRVDRDEPYLEANRWFIHQERAETDAIFIELEAAEADMEEPQEPELHVLSCTRREA